MAKELTLPELGENVDSGDVIKVLVAAGDVIEKEQPIIELETDKATVEVPAAAGGKVSQIHVKEGDKIKVGQKILTVDDAQGGEDARQQPKDQKGTEQKVDAPASGRAGAEPKVVSQKDGGGREPPATHPGAQQAVIESGKTQQKPAEPPEPDSSEEPAVSEKREAPAGQKAASVIDFAPAEATPVPASPKVRRLAREIGVDINQVPGTGAANRISIEDVKEHARQAKTAPAGPAPGGPPAGHLPDFSRWGEIETQAMSSIRRKTAEHMSLSWSAIPHVTQFDKADVSELERLKERFSKDVEAAGGKLTMTAIALKVVAAALKAFPQFNTSVDDRNNQIVYKKYVHVGVAVDTDRGLLVPVIRDVDTKNLIALSAELTQLAERARARKLTLEEMQGGTFTITNLGGIGGTNFTPIVNHPEVAILGIARGSIEPVFVGGKFEPRNILPLALSYDHRVIDGADAARFLRWIASAMEQPFRILLEG